MRELRTGVTGGSTGASRGAPQKPHASLLGTDVLGTCEPRPIRTQPGPDSARPMLAASLRLLEQLQFEPSRVRTLIHVCMHVHPWFEPSPSSNVSITWGARQSLPRVLGDQDDGAPVAQRGR